MLNQVHEYKESLPDKPVIPNKITIFTTKDQETFRKELYEDSNPLFTLLDGNFPGIIPPEES